MGLKSVIKKVVWRIDDMYHDITLTPKKEWEIAKLKRELEAERAKNKFPHINRTQP